MHEILTLNFEKKSLMITTHRLIGKKPIKQVKYKILINIVKEFGVNNKEARFAAFILLSNLASNINLLSANPTKWSKTPK